jgi:hypothetical protein
LKPGDSGKSRKEMYAQDTGSLKHQIGLVTETESESAENAFGSLNRSTSCSTKAALYLTFLSDGVHHSQVRGIGRRGSVTMLSCSVLLMGVLIV